MAALSEDDIKSIFLPFLREFYRFRYEYQQGTEASSLNNVTAEGYIADGMLQFQKPDGQPFVCTYEATSADKAGEVKFSTNTHYLRWDTFGFGAFSAAVLTVLIYLFNKAFIADLGTWGKFMLPLGMALCAGILWYLVMRNWRKYRYIYAIEQFRLYKANEQWVAIGEDVFPSPLNPFLVELKEQCIYNGIGLAVVYADRQVRTLAAPSSLGVFGAEKKMVHWITFSPFYQSITPPVIARGFAAKAWRTVLRPVGQFVYRPVQRITGDKVYTDSAIYKRFMNGSYPVQQWMIVLSVIGVIAIMTASKKEKTEEVLERPTQIYQPPTPSPERQNGFVLKEGEHPIPYGKVHYTDENSGVPRQLEQKATAADATEARPLEYTTAQPASPPKAIVSKPTTKVAPKPKAAAATPLCDRIRSAGGWIIQDNIFSMKERALQRVNDLKEVGITADYFDGNCIDSKGWIVRLGPNISNESVAKTKAAEYLKMLKSAGVQAGIPLAKSVK